MAGLLTPPHMVGPPIVWHPNNTIMPEEYRGSDPAGYAFNYWLRHNCKGFNWLDDYLEIYQGYADLRASFFRASTTRSPTGLPLPFRTRINLRLGGWQRLWNVIPLVYRQAYFPGNSGTTFLAQNISDYSTGVQRVLSDILDQFPAVTDESRGLWRDSDAEIERHMAWMADVTQRSLEEWRIRDQEEAGDADDEMEASDEEEVDDESGDESGDAMEVDG